MRIKHIILFLTTFLFSQIIFAQNNYSSPYIIDESETIDIPRDVTSAMDSLLYSYYAKHAKIGKCKRFGKENMDYPDSIYRKRLNALPYEMAMPYNPQVRAFIDMYAERRRNATENLLGLGNKYYFPMFEDILAKYGVPLELKFLPVIESALNPLATSPVGAGGLWQFMPSTGKMYGLQVTSLVDERRDPVKSTHAAARYLKDLYRIYNDWSMAIAAYNCGPGTVNRAISRSGGKRDFWSLYPYLPAETRGYVPIFVAAAYVMSYYQNHNLCPVEIDLPMYTDTVVVKNRLSFSDVASVLEIPVEDLRVLNPQYRKDIVPEGYALCLPTHYAAKFDKNASTIYDMCLVKQQCAVVPNEEISPAPIPKKTTATKTRIHQVRRGETLSGIADRYDVTVAQIKKWNGLRGSTVKAGQRLTIKK